MNRTIVQQGADFTVLPEERAAPDVVAGAIYDFAGFLTTRRPAIAVGASALTYPVAELVREWAAARGLSLREADVEHWARRLAAPARTYRSAAQLDWEDRHRR